MPYDFSATGKAAMGRIPVPNLSMDAIRSASRAATQRERTQRFALCGLIVLASLGAAVAVARVYDGVHIWLSGGKAAATVRSMALLKYPMASDVQRIASNATFPVVMPVGLPAGTRIHQIMYSPSAHPNTIFVQIQSARGDSKGGFFLLDPSSVDPDTTTLPAATRPSLREVEQWKIGGETVLAYAFASDRASIKAQMSASSPSESLAASRPMLWRVEILGQATSAVANRAERLAPTSSRSVLLDRGHLKSLTGLLAQNKPMLDAREVFLSDIPQTSNGPNYMKAKYAWPKTVAVDARGLRAIAAALRAAGKTTTNCDCEVLFDRPNDAAYWIWLIPRTGSAPAAKFSVDATTFGVTQLRA